MKSVSQNEILDISCVSFSIICVAKILGNRNHGYLIYVDTNCGLNSKCNFIKYSILFYESKSKRNKKGERGERIFFYFASRKIWAFHIEQACEKLNMGEP